MVRARVVAVVGLVAGLGIVGCGRDASPARGPGGVVVEAGEESVFSLRVGDCVQPPTELGDAERPELERVTAVPCSEPHTHEVFARPLFTATDAYPGPNQLRAFADGACLSEFEGYVGVPYEDSALRFSYLLPSLRSWNEGDDRTVVCLLVATDERLTSSARASGL
jgi:hypothetical protein